MVVPAVSTVKLPTRATLEQRRRAKVTGQSLSTSWTLVEHLLAAADQHHPIPQV